MIARDRSYSDLRDELKGKKVVIWTCNTCARLCFDIGGSESAGRLAEALRKDGIDVLGVYDTSASCLEGKIRKKEDREVLDRADIILSLTCNIGALCVKRVLGKEVLNPAVTLGAGFAGEDRTLYICRDDGKELTIEDLREAASERGLHCDPYV